MHRRANSTVSVHIQQSKSSVKRDAPKLQDNLISELKRTAILRRSIKDVKKRASEIKTPKKYDKVKSKVRGNLDSQERARKRKQRSQGVSVTSLDSDYYGYNKKQFRARHGRSQSVSVADLSTPTIPEQNVPNPDRLAILIATRQEEIDRKEREL